MRRKTFDQLVNLKLLRLEIYNTLDNIIESANKLNIESCKVGKTYLGAKIENIAENIIKISNEMISNNNKVERNFDSITDLILRME